MPHYISENIKTIHLMGICGTGMAALAGMLHDKGFNVTGSDQSIYPPMSTFLDSLGIEIMKGYDGTHLKNADLVVVGNVIRRDNPEAKALLEKDLPYISMPEAVSHFLIQDRRSIVVAGTHGKTTTTSLLAYLFYSCGADPSFFIGGIAGNFNTNHRIGKGEWFIIEGDEYDTAFFDKKSKFYHYKPEVVILTSVEFDHGDIFRDFMAIKKAFMELIEIIPAHGLLIANGDDPAVREIARAAKCAKYFYTLKDKTCWHVSDIKRISKGAFFTLHNKKEQIGSYFLPMSGDHNIMNTVAALAVCRLAGIDMGKTVSGLKGFLLPKRRQEVIGSKNGITLIDDFAHHPTAVRETVSAVKKHNPDKRLIAVFEPRTNTSRRNIFQDEYAKVFVDADIAVIMEAPRLNELPEEERFSSRKLAASLEQQGIKAFHAHSVTEITEYVISVSRPDDIVLIMSNGSFDGLCGMLGTGLGIQD